MEDSFELGWPSRTSMLGHIGIQAAGGATTEQGLGLSAPVCQETGW